jgi:Protein of unknown function (DUF4232)
MLEKTGSLLAVAAVSASILALTACGGNSGGAAAGGAQGASSPATAASSAAASGAPASGGPASGQTGVQTTAKRTPECNVRQLRISYTDNAQINQGALNGMSKTDNVVMFVNVSHSTCVIQGYPGVAALNAHGAQIQQARRSGERVHPVYLRPGGVASALVSADTASCNMPSRVAGLLVTAPDQYSSTRLSSPGEMCLGSMTVHPVVPGNAAGFVF